MKQLYALVLLSLDWSIYIIVISNFPTKLSKSLFCWFWPDCGWFGGLPTGFGTRFCSHGLQQGHMWCRQCFWRFWCPFSAAPWAETCHARADKYFMQLCWCWLVGVGGNYLFCIGIVWLEPRFEGDSAKVQSSLAVSPLCLFHLVSTICDFVSFCAVPRRFLDHLPVEAFLSFQMPASAFGDVWVHVGLAAWTDFQKDCLLLLHGRLFVWLMKLQRLRPLRLLSLGHFGSNGKLGKVEIGKAPGQLVLWHLPWPPMAECALQHVLNIAFEECNDCTRIEHLIKLMQYSQIIR